MKYIQYRSNLLSPNGELLFRSIGMEPSNA